MYEELTAFLGQRVIHVVRDCPHVPGMLYGLELEMEGLNVNVSRSVEKWPAGWCCVEDGSLRGESAEWVFAAPANLENSIARVDGLFEYLNGRKARPQESYRTSTHVHLNFTDKYVYQVVNFFVLYTVVEELLLRYCGPDRKGNLHCLGFVDAEGILEAIEEALLRSHNFHDIGQGLRYSGCNLSSLNKFGTIEIRIMRGLTSPEPVKEWIGVLSDLFDYACNTMTNPREFIEGFSHEGVDVMLNRVLKDNNLKALTTPNSRDLVFEGVRLIQPLCYALDGGYQNLDIPGLQRVQEVQEEKPKKRVRGQVNPFNLDLAPPMRQEWVMPVQPVEDL